MFHGLLYVSVVEIKRNVYKALKIIYDGDKYFISFAFVSGKYLNKAFFFCLSYFYFCACRGFRALHSKRHSLYIIYKFIVLFYQGSSVPCHLIINVML
jgi:hypothetical protein